MKNCLHVFLGDDPVGELRETESGLLAFQYTESWQKNGFSISPIDLPLSSEVFIADYDPFNGNFGVFADSLPDGWGSLLLDRYFSERNINYKNLPQLERLAYIGNQGRGALEYKPNKSFLQTLKNLDFDAIAKHCDAILNEEALKKPNVLELVRGAGSSGGARPKVFAEIDGEEWLVKFPATLEPRDIGKTEYNYSLLAKKCDISMPETKLVNDKFFATKRFDRVDGKKIHTVTVAGLLSADYRQPIYDYEQILQLTGALTQSQVEINQMFLRMLFNVEIGNCDDHVKNFAFQYTDGKWVNSPAYDIVPMRGFNDNHSTSINGKGQPTEEDYKVLAEKFGVEEWQSMLNNIRNVLGK